MLEQGVPGDEAEHHIQPPTLPDFVQEFATRREIPLADPRLSDAVEHFYRDVANNATVDNYIPLLWDGYWRVYVEKLAKEQAAAETSSNLAPLFSFDEPSVEQNVNSEPQLDSAAIALLSAWWSSVNYP